MPAHAERATAIYAPAQLWFAETALGEAQKASAQGRHALARRLAAQAQLDAGLAWTMTDEAALRRAAVRLYWTAAALRSESAMSQSLASARPDLNAPQPRPITMHSLP